MSSSDVDRTVEVNNEEQDTQVADETNIDDSEEAFDFSDEYQKWKGETGEVLGYLDQLRRCLDDRVVQVRAESLGALFENADDVEAMRHELEKVRKMLRAAEAFLSDDFSSSLEALRQSLATYSEVTLGKLNDEHEELSASGTATGQSFSCHITVGCTVHMPNRKHDTN